MRRVLLAIVVAAGVIGGLAHEANAFHHVIRARCISYYPGLYSFGYCGAPCPPPPYTFPCTWSYPKYCGPFASCYDGRVLCSTGKRHHCGLLCRRGGGLLGCAPCGYGSGCGYGCGGCDSCGSCGDCGSCGSSCGSCGSGCGTDGGCENCNVGTSEGSEAGRTFETDEKVLYDGPADQAPSHNAPPEPEADPSASSIFQRPFRLTSAKTEQADGSRDFARGMQAYYDDNMTAALEAFEVAVAAEPQNALYAYLRALAMYNLHGAEAANDWLAQAVQLEREQPITQWGRRMERIQGRARLWVEQARVAGGVGR